MGHHMKENDMQRGLTMAWTGRTEIQSVITEFPFELVREPAQMRGVNVDGWSWIVGSDDGQIIGKPVADSYQFLTNGMWLERIRNAMEAFPSAVIESLGTFDGRRKRYVTVRLNDSRETFRIGGREFQSRLNLHGSLDGSTPDVWKGSTICTVCFNTNAMSLAEDSDFRVSAKHSKNHVEAWDNMEAAFEAVFHRSTEFERLFQTAEQTPVNEDKARAIYAGWLGEGKEVSSRTLGIVDRMVELFQTGKGNRGETGLDVISGVTDFYSHESSGKAESGENRMKQFTSSEIGSGAKAKDQFLADVRTKDFRFNKQAVAQLAKMGERTLELSTTE